MNKRHEAPNATLAPSKAGRGSGRDRFNAMGEQANKRPARRFDRQQLTALNRERIDE